VRQIGMSFLLKLFIYPNKINNNILMLFSGKGMSAGSFIFRAGVEKCHICQQTLRQPMRLSCLHSYCRQCLEGIHAEQYMGQRGLKCPQCGIFTSLNTSNIKKEKLLEILILMEKYRNGKIQDCQVCNMDNKKKKKTEKNLMFCTNCRKFMCEKCKEAHKHREIKKPPIDVIDASFYCYNRNLERKQIYCNTCEDLVCIFCHVDFKGCTKH
jgi:hypothetical protein